MPPEDFLSASMCESNKFSSSFLRFCSSRRNWEPNDRRICFEDTIKI